MPTTTMLLTPVGRGAVATIVVRGPEACAVVQRHFQHAGRRSLSGSPAGRILFGRWGAPAGEEMVACRLPNGDIELHCHGGRLAASRILDDLAHEGCRIAPFSPLLNHDGTLIQREALAALAVARTERTAAILLDQYQGTLERECREILVNCQTSIARTAQRLTQLLARGPLGLHLTRPWKIVLAGQPNVGKSSLMNALLGYERAIVFDQPGTTRDAVVTETALAGWPVELSDTAGLRLTVDALELAGIERARQQVAQADCLLLVFDASQAWSGQDEQLLAAYPQAVVIHNKADQAIDQPRPAGLRTVAIGKRGIEELIGAVVQRLVPYNPPEQSAVPFSARQIAWLQAAHRAATQGDPPLVEACLEQLLTSCAMPALNH
jgi:tRNA modification GTPase